MLTFNDLDFEQHGVWPKCKHATMVFDNGYGISVLTGTSGASGFSGPYAGPNEFEVAVMEGGSLDTLKLCYSTDLTDDVLGHQSKSDVTQIMKAIQELE